MPRPVPIMAPSFPMVVSIGDPRPDKIGTGLVALRISMFNMYILQSLKSGMYYIGSTDELEKRLIRHNKGYSRYTKGKGPFKLVHKEEFASRSEAKKREYYIKSLKSRYAIEILITGATV